MALNDIAGQGYTSALRIDGTLLCLNPTQLSDNTEIIRSGTGWNSAAAFSVGSAGLPTRDIYFTTMNVGGPLTRQALDIFERYFFDWRANNQLQGILPVELNYANAESYSALYSFAETGTITVDPTSMASWSITIKILGWVRTSANSPPTPATSNTGMNWFSPTTAPIPGWANTVINNEQPGATLSFSITMSNGYKFLPVMELTNPTGPAAPIRYCTHGPLETKITLSTLAPPDATPGMVTNNLKLVFGGSNAAPSMSAGVTLQRRAWTFPIATREAALEWGSVAEPNNPIKIGAVWSPIGATPSYS